MLWFDVEIERYTTSSAPYVVAVQLWFDVENKRYTTCLSSIVTSPRLWFDVKHIIYRVQIIVVVWRIVMVWICKGSNHPKLAY